MPAHTAPMRRSRRSSLRRLRSQAVMELLNIPLQAAIWFGWVRVPVTAANLAGFAALAVLLVVGAAYWALKLRQLQRRARVLAGLRYFAVARVVLPAVLAAVLAAGVAAAVRHPGAQSWPGLAFAAFAVLEYVNYFLVQLMHDTPADLRRLVRSGLRRAHLARDLAAAP